MARGLEFRAYPKGSNETANMEVGPNNHVCYGFLALIPLWQSHWTLRVSFCVQFCCSTVLFRLYSRGSGFGYVAPFLAHSPRYYKEPDVSIRSKNHAFSSPSMSYTSYMQLHAPLGEGRLVSVLAPRSWVSDSCSCGGRWSQRV